MRLVKNHAADIKWRNGCVHWVRITPRADVFPARVSKALFMISVVGNPFCRGKIFYALADALFSLSDHVTFLVADSLQKYNLAASKYVKRDEEVILQAYQLGVTWFEQHAGYFITKLPAAHQEVEQQEVEQRVIDHLMTMCQQLQAMSIGDKKNKFVDTIIAQCNQLSLRFNIMRWDHWVHYDQEKLQAVENLADEDEQFYFACQAYGKELY